VGVKQHDFFLYDIEKMTDKQWQKYALRLKELLALENSPVATSCFKGQIPKEHSAGKVRICRAILDASEGKLIYIGKGNNDCFGASWHLGFRSVNKIRRLKEIFKKFTVETEKIFSCGEAAERLFAQMEEPPDNKDNYFALAPAEKAEFFPELIIFVVNPQEASRLLTLLTFSDGIMPKIKIGGPTCRMSITYPLLSREVNISFYDYTSRIISKIKKDKLIVSVPYSKVPEIVKNIDRCSAGKAKVGLALKRSTHSSRRSPS